LNQLRSSDPGEKWNGLKDLCNYWAMCNEETLVGFPINTTLQILLKILQESDSAMPELELMAIRSLLNLYELLSPIHSPLIIQEFVPLLISRLYSIEYIELAESCISLLSKVRVHVAVLWLIASCHPI
jgi:E3 ubiquitin-protein ligase TRIP12